MQITLRRGRAICPSPFRTRSAFILPAAACIKEAELFTHEVPEGPPALVTVGRHRGRPRWHGAAERCQDPAPRLHTVS